MSELDDIRAAEEENYKISVGLLGDSVSLVEDLVDLYKLLTDTHLNFFEGRVRRIRERP